MNPVLIVWRRRGWVFLGLIAGVIIAFVYLSTATSIYRSEARLYVQPASGSASGGTPSDPSATSTPSNVAETFLYTQRELIRSSAIVNSALQAAPAPGLRQLRTLTGIDNPAMFIVSGLDVQLVPKTEIIAVAFESPNADDAAQIVNSVVEAYFNFQIKQGRPNAGEALRVLNEEKNKVETNLADKLRLMSEFKQTNGGPIGQDRVTTLTQKLTQANGNLNTAQTELTDARTALESAKTSGQDAMQMRQQLESRQFKGVPPVLVQEDAQLRAELKQLQTALDTEKEHVMARHPNVRQLEAKIDKQNARIAEHDQQLVDGYLIAMQSIVEGSEKRLAEMKQTAEDLQKQLDQTKTLTTDYTKLDADLQLAQKQLELVTVRMKEVAIGADLATPRVSILDHARPAAAPVRPDRRQVLLNGLLGGLAAGIVLALLRHTLSPRRDAELQV